MGLNVVSNIHLDKGWKYISYYISSSMTHFSLNKPEDIYIEVIPTKNVDTMK
jgi:hypothetical protein